MQQYFGVRKVCDQDNLVGSQSSRHNKFVIMVKSRVPCRMHETLFRPNLYAATGNLFESGKQYRRAAHFYKLHMMANADIANPALSLSLARLAAAYDWDSIASGA